MDLSPSAAAAAAFPRQQQPPRIRHPAHPFRSHHNLVPIQRPHSTSPTITPTQHPNQHQLRTAIYYHYYHHQPSNLSPSTSASASTSITTITHLPPLVNLNPRILPRSSTPSNKKSSASVYHPSHHQHTSIAPNSAQPNQLLHQRPLPQHTHSSTDPRSTSYHLSSSSTAYRNPPSPSIPPVNRSTSRSIQNHHYCPLTRANSLPHHRNHHHKSAHHHHHRQPPIIHTSHDHHHTNFNSISSIITNHSSSSSSSTTSLSASSFFSPEDLKRFNHQTSIPNSNSSFVSAPNHHNKLNSSPPPPPPLSRLPTSPTPASAVTGSSGITVIGKMVEYDSDHSSSRREAISKALRAVSRTGFEKRSRSKTTNDDDEDEGEIEEDLGTKVTSRSSSFDHHHLQNDLNSSGNIKNPGAVLRRRRSSDSITNTPNTITHPRLPGSDNIHKNYLLLNHLGELTPTRRRSEQNEVHQEFTKRTIRSTTTSTTMSDDDEMMMMINRKRTPRLNTSSPPVIAKELGTRKLESLLLTDHHQNEIDSNNSKRSKADHSMSILQKLTNRNSNHRLDLITNRSSSLSRITRNKPGRVVDQEGEGGRRIELSRTTSFRKEKSDGCGREEEQVINNRLVGERGGSEEGDIMTLTIPLAKSQSSRSSLLLSPTSTSTTTSTSTSISNSPSRSSSSLPLHLPPPGSQTSGYISFASLNLFAPPSPPESIHGE